MFRLRVRKGKGIGFNKLGQERVKVTGYLQCFYAQVVFKRFFILVFLPPFLKVCLPCVVVVVTLVLAPLNVVAQLLLDLN